MCSIRPIRRSLHRNKSSKLIVSQPIRAQSINNRPLIKKTTICNPRADKNEHRTVDHLDDRTKKIVSGYINDIQRKLLSIHGNDLNYLIPTNVSLFCLELVDDYFMINTGTFEWIIDGVLFTQLLAMPNRQKMQSKIFYIGNVPWRLEIYPNGNGTNNSGDVRISLRNLSMPTTWSYVYSRNHYQVKELRASSTTIQSMFGLFAMSLCT